MVYRFADYVNSFMHTPQLYVFARTTEWAVYESIQSEIFEHLLAAAHIFDLRVFQEPTGLDFSSFAGTFKG